MKKISNKNIEMLKKNSYPGRCIIIGMTPDAKNFVQIYCIMGRSENSRNRIFVEEKGEVKTKAWDESKVKDPSLIIYNVTKVFENMHIITNGDHTDTIVDYVKEGQSFEDALNTRKFEPDEPNYTPRISGIIQMDNNKCIYKLSILKSFLNSSISCLRQYYNYESAIPGIGHCIHTYKGDGNPLPSFENEPYVVPILDNIDETLNLYWNIINEENKVSLLVKYINIETKKYQIKIINKHN
ncbi:MAG: IMP cyclohydrolase [Clostridiales bacterium]